jgi:hypothetical protein
MPNDEFTPGDATDVAHKCTIATTLNNHPLRPNDTLGEYGVSTSEQILLIKTRIRTNNDFGLPHHGRSIDPNALKDIDTDTKLADLSNVIFEQSFDVASDIPFAASEMDVPSGTGTGERASADAVSNAASAIAEFTRQNPVQALMISAAMGMLMGFMLGGMRR